VDGAWDTLFQTVETLTAAGMSSDESDVDGSQKPIFWVKKLVWRDKGLTDYMKLVDRDHNTTNAYGNRRAGNPPRTRVRRHRNPQSNRDPPIGLPINFYDEVWYQGLTRRQKNDLKPKQAVVLPAIEYQ